MAADLEAHQDGSVMRKIRVVGQIRNGRVVQVKGVIYS
jgi:hypothetical protein